MTILSIGDKYKITHHNRFENSIVRIESFPNDKASEVILLECWICLKRFKQHDGVALFIQNKFLKYPLIQHNRNGANE